MATQSNSAIRAQTVRRASVVLTAANSVLSGPASGGSPAITAIKLCDVGSNGISWLVKLGVTPRATIAAFNIQLFWSPDAGATMYYITAFSISAASSLPFKETDIGLSETVTRQLGSASSFWVASDTALTGGIVVNAEVEDA